MESVERCADGRCQGKETQTTKISNRVNSIRTIVKPFGYNAKPDSNRVKKAFSHDGRDGLIGVSGGDFVGAGHLQHASLVEVLSEDLQAHRKAGLCFAARNRNPWNTGE